MPIAQADGVQLSYERRGEGPPLLMIMGLSGTFSHWESSFLTALSSRHELILYDHRGVGASTRVSEPFSIAQLAGDAIALLDALQLPEVDVLGFSMGGMVAQELVLSAPERVNALVLASTYCGGQGSQTATRKAIEKLGAGMSSGDVERALRAGWEVNVAEAFAGDEQAFARFRAVGLERRVAVTVVMEQLKAVAAHDTSARFGAVRAPTLVIHGDLDEMVPIENGRMIARLIEGSKLQVLPGSGHMFFWEQPQKAAELILEHLAGTREARGAETQLLSR